MDRTGNSFQNGAAADTDQAEGNKIMTSVRHLKPGLIWPGHVTLRINVSLAGELSR